VNPSPPGICPSQGDCANRASSTVRSLSFRPCCYTTVITISPLASFSSLLVPKTLLSLFHPHNHHPSDKTSIAIFNNIGQRKRRDGTETEQQTSIQNIDEYVHST